MGDVAGAVIRHDAGDGDAFVGVPGDEASKEGGCGRGSFVGEDLGISEAGGIIDGDMDELPAGSPIGALSSVAGDAMSDDLDAAELLGIDVDELTGAVSLVVKNGRLGIQVLESREAVSGQDAGHGGGTGTNSRGDLGSSLSAMAQPEDLLDEDRRGLPRRALGPRAAIDQRRRAGLLIATLPFPGRSAGNSGRLGGAGQGDAGLDTLDQQHSTGRATSSILVKLHLGSFAEAVALNTSSLIEEGPDGQLLHVNNVLRNHS
jgi:hypothetical protein